MSELINNSEFRKSRLKRLILKLHEGESPEKVRQELIRTLQGIPYGEVVEVEQELIEEGLPQEEVLRLCDVHSMVLEGNIDLSGMEEIPEGHPVDVMIHENKEINRVAIEAEHIISDIISGDEDNIENAKLRLRGKFNDLMDVDKHYQRKEYLLFPFLEKRGITGPPKVMWGKHDEIRDQLKASIEILKTEQTSRDELIASAEMVMIPALKSVRDMTGKEEEILLPMSLDELAIEDWWKIHQQTLEIGFTLYDPQTDWKPEGLSLSEEEESARSEAGTIQLPSGSFTSAEIMTILNTMPVDMTFVDRNDKVKYFTQGKERIFTRSRSIINRDVRLCHPPSSVDIVEKIIDDFRNGRESYAPFWIQMRGKFIHIAYYALRNDEGEYLGTLEVSQDLTELRKLEGEQRILSYKSNENDEGK